MGIIFSQVNDYDMRAATHEMAVKSLQINSPVLRLVVFRNDSNYKDQGTDFNPLSPSVAVT